MDEMSKNMSFEYGDDPKFREQETGHVYFETGVDESTEPFAKNVKLEAHTEYTSHVNGKIGEGGGANVVFGTLVISGNSASIEGVNFEEAKAAFLSNEKVLIYHAYEGFLFYMPIIRYDGESNILVFNYMGAANLSWHSDNSVTGV